MNKKTENDIIPANNGRLFWLAIGIIFFLLIYLLKGVLLPFILGALIAYFLDPAADKLEEWHFSRTLATVTITLTFFTTVAVFLLFAIPTIVSQLSGLFSDLPSYVLEIEGKYEKQLFHWIGTLPKNHAESIKDAVSNFSGTMLKIVGDMVGSMFQSGIAIINILSLILITPVVAFYLLRDWDVIKLRFYALLPRKHEKIIREQLMLVDTAIAGFVRGQTNVCLLLGSFYAIALSLVGLKFGVLIGMASGILVIIPYVGIMFGAAVGISVAYFQFGDIHGALPVLLIFVIGQVVESNFITPKLVGEKVGLHPAWIIFGMLAGASLFGFVGILIAVPVSAVFGVLIRFATSYYLASKYYIER